MQEFDWGNNVSNKEKKLKLAQRMAKRVKDGEVIGFGSGSTSYLTIEEIAKKIKTENLKIKAIPTSNIIKDLCDKLGIETTSLDKEKPDWCFDGADEVDPHNWLIKGMGAALFKEKQNIKACKENYILVDESKFVDFLGQKHLVPIECEENKIEEIQKQLKELGAIDFEIMYSKVNNGPLITDNGNIILLTKFDKIRI